MKEYKEVKLLKNVCLFDKINQKTNTWKLLNQEEQQKIKDFFDTNKDITTDFTYWCSYLNSGLVVSVQDLIEVINEDTIEAAGPIVDHENEVQQFKKMGNGTFDSNFKGKKNTIYLQFNMKLLEAFAYDLIFISMNHSQDNQYSLLVIDNNQMRIGHFNSHKHPIAKYKPNHKYRKDVDFIKKHLDIFFEEVHNLVMFKEKDNQDVENTIEAGVGVDNEGEIVFEKRLIMDMERRSREFIISNKVRLDKYNFGEFLNCIEQNEGSQVQGS